MKKIIIYIMLGVFFSACQNAEETIDSIDLVNDKPIQRAAGDLKSTGWDWTTDEVLPLYRSRSEDNKSIPIYGAKTPFYSQHVLAEELDMYEEDGWKLVFRNFGSPEVTPVGGLPSFALYNKYTGILRIMTYIPMELRANYTHLLSTLEYSTSSDRSTILTFYSDFDQSDIAHHDPEQKIFYTGECYDYQHFWTHADIVLTGYDQDVLNKDVVFDYRIKGVEITTGSAWGEIWGSATQVLSQRSVSGFWKLVDQLKNGADTGVSFFNSTQDLIGVIDKIASGETKVETDSTESKAELKGFGTVISAVTAAIGIVKGFISKSKGNSQIPIKFNADLDVKLELSTELSLYHCKIALNPNSSHVSAIKPVQNIKWGVFNFKDYIPCRKDLYYMVWHNQRPQEMDYLDLNTIEQRFVSNLVINPEITDVEIRGGFVTPKPFRGFSMYSNFSNVEYTHGVYLVQNYRIDEAAIQFIIKYQHPSEGEKEVKIIKTFGTNYYPGVTLWEDMCMEYGECPDGSCYRDPRRQAEFEYFTEKYEERRR